MSDPTTRPLTEETVTAPNPPEAPTKVPHLVVALLLLGTAATWALVVGGALTPSALPYAVPALLVVAGVGGLAALALGSRRRAAPGGDATYDTEPDDQVHRTEEM